MISRIELAKKSQGFMKYAKTCSNCKNFRFGEETIGPYTTIKKLRCSIGNFKVVRSNTCEIWEEILPESLKEQA